MLTGVTIMEGKLGEAGVSVGSGSAGASGVSIWGAGVGSGVGAGDVSLCGVGGS